MPFDDTIDPNYNADNPQASGPSVDSNYGALSDNSTNGGGATNIGSSLSNFLTGVTGAATSGNTLYNTILGKKPATAAKANALSASTVSAKLISALPWIIGGGILLVLGFVFFRRK